MWVWRLGLLQKKNDALFKKHKHRHLLNPQDPMLRLTLLPSWSPTHSCSCLVLPWATGPTASRWEGLATTATLISLFVTLFRRWWDIPKWYLTSPDPSSSSFSLESNWQKMFSNGFLQTLANTFSLPLKNRNRQLTGVIVKPLLRMDIIKRQTSYIREN